MNQWLHDEWPDARGDRRGEGVKVAVLDSGVDASHMAVGAVNGYLSVSVASDGVTFSTAPHADAFGHGTACAGIIRSLAPACELYSIKVLGSALSGRAAALTAGLRWAIDHGIHICNLSLGTTRRELHAELHELTYIAYSRNVTLVAAANNIPVPSYPSSCPSVIAVAAHESADPYRISHIALPVAEFGARGIDVPVAWLDGGWRTLSGNSYAAPHVTGLIATILSKHPGLQSFELRTILRALATQVQPLRKEVTTRIISH
jgi:subtilisin family serine protease